MRHASAPEPVGRLDKTRDTAWSLLLVGVLRGLVQGDKTRVASCKYYIYTVRRESHVTLEATSSVKSLLCHPAHRWKPTDFRSAVLASSVYGTTKTNCTYALFMTGRTGSSSPGLMISTAWTYNTTEVTVPVTALQQNLEMCATVPPFCGVAPLSTGGTSNWTFAQQRCRV
jgi:hypothetical protein